MAKIDWPELKIGEGVDHEIHLHPDFFSDLKNYIEGGLNCTREEMHNKIEEITLRAQLEQTAEECSELSQACLKLIRSIGNGNPCDIPPCIATDKVVEEISDTMVAIEFLIRKMKAYNLVNYDISDRIDTIASGKTARWCTRLEDDRNG